MTDRIIASRPSMEQVSAIVSFMEKHRALGLGQLRGLEGREKSKRLWYKLSRIINDTPGPNRPMKSWIKYWADKKSTVRAKVQAGGGDPNGLCSNIEKKIWDLFLADDTKSKSGKVKQETTFVNESFYNEEEQYEPEGNMDQTADDTQTDQNHDEDSMQGFDEPSVDLEERQSAIMEKILKVMSDQSSALSQLAHASHINAQAMERLADASQLQARAIDRLATTFESISAATHDVRTAIVDIDVTMKRFYSTSPT
ncbi:uncharacterized protein LOC142975703 [Anticarsia gemmatalis]|uniref:uncharacterized protein LOC142975703 n=1 Tax=Anticarsia gemmatalis TaxID=129554 RepID=UPI003F763FDF